MNLKLNINNPKSENPSYCIATSKWIKGKKGEKGHSKTVKVKDIGTYKQLISLGHLDPKAYALEVLEEYKKELEENFFININQEIDLSKQIKESDDLVSKSNIKNIGYLYLVKLMKDLKIKEFFNTISKSKKVKYDPFDIFKYLVSARILSPKSKKGTFDDLDNYFNDYQFSKDDIYRFLDVLDECSIPLQYHVFEKSKKIIDRDTSILYYDCTNYYFESESEDEDIYVDDSIQYGFRKYGVSKEHRPNPIVEMGMFMDKKGIPVSYCLQRGNINEQVTAIPLEKEMNEKGNINRFIFCSDAGLASLRNKVYNSKKNNKAYIVTQSIKKLTNAEQELIMKDINWKFLNDDSKASIEELKNICTKIILNKELTNIERDIVNKDVIYKDFPITFKGNIDDRFTVHESRLIITFSIKYYLYQMKIQERQISSAKDIINSNKSDKLGPNDVRRFIKKVNKESLEFTLDNELIEKERSYFGLYSLATSLEDDPKELLALNSRRWKIEECFKVMKTYFKARPVYVYTKEHIRAHFLICFVALVIYRIMENKLEIENKNYSGLNLITTLKNMNVKEIVADIYDHCYESSLILQDLEKVFKLGLDKEKYTGKNLRKLL